MSASSRMINLNPALHDPIGRQIGSGEGVSVAEAGKVGGARLD